VVWRTAMGSCLPSHKTEYNA